MLNFQHKLIRFLFFIAVTAAFGQSETDAQKKMDSLIQGSYAAVYAYDYETAITNSREVIKLSKELKDNYYASRGYTRLGSIYLSMKDTVNSFEYYNKSLEYALKTKRDTVIAVVYNDLGNAIMEMGGDEIKARANFEKSLAYNKKGKRSELGLLVNHMNLAWTHINKKELKEALPYLNTSRRSIEKHPSLHPLYSINLDILRGRYHLYRNVDINRAISILEGAAERAANGNFLHQSSEAQKYLSLAYEKKGDLKAALISVKKENEFKLEHEKILRKQQLAESNSRFKVEQYQEDVEDAKREQLLSNEVASRSKGRATLYLVICLTLAVGLLSVFLLYKSRQKFVKKLSEKNIELIKAKEDAERLSKLKTQFFSTVSHELRTPLYGVIGLSSILLDDDDLKSHRDDLKSLKFSADYLLALINDVLTLNKADAKGMKLEKTPFSLKNLLKNITSTFTFSLQQNNNKLNVIIDEAVPDRLLGDSIKLSQILMNLVGNAVKFNENGTIEIVIKLVERTRDGIYKTQFFIKDNGIGIPKEKQASIFEDFSQVENNNYNYQGTGLGLPIVKKLLTVFGSDIDLVSDAGRGAIFSFIIPLEENTSNIDVHDEEILQTNLQAPSFSDIHILIVDDNKINQKVTQKILQSRNFKTSLADNGQEAVTMAQKNNYGLILMDIHMPVMGGVEATKNIRTFDTQTPIIALTAVEIEEARNAIIEAGMNDVILKPYDVAQFLTVILRNLNTVYKD